MVVGAKLDDTPGTSAGSVEVYEYSCGSWTKMGSTINGEAAYDNFGRAVSINGAGTRIAVGAPNNDGNGSDAGQVRVYEWNGSAWIQLGIDLDGEAANDHSGWSVDMNEAGDRIVIGEIENAAGGTRRGQVRVFEWDGFAWSQLGNDLHGLGTNDKFGWNVSISASGNKIIVGAPEDDDGGSNSGTVKIYELIGSTWTQVGNTIVGQSGNQAGYAVSISADGNRVAVGMRAFSSSKGRARIFDLVGSTWSQVGSDIIGEANLDFFGASIVMNDVGTRLLIGAYLNDGNGTSSGHARVYDLVGTTWTQLDDDIDGEEANDNLGFGLGMSASGHRIAVGSYGGDNNSNVNTGDVKVFSVNTICTTPLSITITETEDGTFTYASTEYCKSGSNPTPTITGTMGGTFSSTAGLSINGSTGEINIAASTAGT